MPYMRCFYCSKPFYYSQDFIATQLQCYSRVYPEVSTEKFQKSASKIEALVPQAELFLKKVRQSKDYAKNIRSLAQEGKTNEVKKKINESGLTAKIDIDYNPDQITILLYNQSGSLTIILPW